ncbi:MAG: 16S rRNA (cytidine(1402)-2'-O)-methyltransferase [Micrococcales bacterium]|nr:16S rRNA (cytidine(1402)-2'-O)-methyltransferase [Micrococcales bacterium]MCL2667712.1 16S rRNA (cytidine(1402)-2'-O)-methyltransferase [Micrococcales bacterium]
MDPGTLVLAATPIGNTDDASPRLRRLLAEADLVAAEDTRRVHALAARLGVRVAGRVLCVHDHNEAARADDLLAVVAGGGTVVVVTDAGMPSVSDPGYRLVTAAVAADLPVTVAPGPSAVLAALAVSGLPTDRFCFEGFLPRRSGERSRALAALADEPRTLVAFEAPHRLPVLLAAMVEAFGPDRHAAVCRELTKTHEEVLRGPLSDLASWAAACEVRGEIVVVVAGARPPVGVVTDTLVAEVLADIDTGTRLKDAVAQAAARTGTRRRDLYAAVVAHRTATDG